MDQLHWILNQVDEGSKAIERQSVGYDLPETVAYIEYVVAGRENASYRWRGVLTSYDGIGLDPNTRTVPVRVVVDRPRSYFDEDDQEIELNNPPALVRGMYVNVELRLKPNVPLALIPKEALKPGNRVLQFIPDESVIDAVEPNQGSEQMAGNEPQKETEQGIEDNSSSFDPNQWTAGSIQVLRRVNVVGPMVTDEGQETLVCEVVDGAVNDGSYVVVSPVSYMSASEQLKARARSEKMREPTSKAPKLASQPSEEPSR